MKIEEASNGKAVHCGPGMAAIFRGLTRSDQVEEPTEPPELSTFHTQPDPANSAIMLVFQNISTAPENRSTSQEVCGPAVVRGLLANRHVDRNFGWHITSEPRHLP